MRVPRFTISLMASLLNSSCESFFSALGLPSGTFSVAFDCPAKRDKFSGLPYFPRFLVALASHVANSIVPISFQGVMCLATECDVTCCSLASLRPWHQVREFKFPSLVATVPVFACRGCFG